MTESVEHDYRAAIVENLSILQKTSKSEPAGAFKSRVYAKAIAAIQSVDRIQSMNDLPDGLGPKVREKIAEILATGHLASAERALATKAPSSLEAFEKIFGVGPKKASELVAAGYRTIADLRAALAAGTLTLTKNQVVGLRVYEDLLERIPRAEMLEHEATIKAMVPTATLVGSFRRGSADSGDIDVLVPAETTDIKNLVAALQALGYITDVLTLGPTKSFGLVALPTKPSRRLDILVTPAEEMPFATLYFTGCDTFNVSMRAHAAVSGYRLNEHGLLHVASNKFVAGIRHERDIFAALKMKWKEPGDRNGPC